MKTKLNTRTKMSLTGTRLSRLETSVMTELENAYDPIVLEKAMHAATQALTDIGINSVSVQPYAAVKAIVVKAVLNEIIPG